MSQPRFGSSSPELINSAVLELMRCRASCAFSVPCAGQLYGHPEVAPARSTSAEPNCLGFAPGRNGQSTAWATPALGESCRATTRPARLLLLHSYTRINCQGHWGLTAYSISVIGALHCGVSKRSRAGVQNIFTSEKFVLLWGQHMLLVFAWNHNCWKRSTLLFRRHIFLRAVMLL